MKKFLFTFLLFPCILVQANEVIEDYLDIASNYCIHGNYNDAIVYIEKIIQLEPSNTEFIELKNVLTRNSNPLSKSYLSSQDSTIKQALAYKMEGNKDKEISTLSNSNTYWANFLLADYYKQKKDYDKAILYFQNAENLKPNFSQTYLGFSDVYFEKKNFTKALEYVDKYLKYNSKSDIAYAKRAEININLGQINNAEDDIKKALYIDENIVYLLLKAKILYIKGNYYEAHRELYLLTRNIQSSEVYKYLGLCDYKLNDLTNALLNINKAIILSDDDKELISTYNEIKIKLEKDEKKK